MSVHEKNVLFIEYGLFLSIPPQGREYSTQGKGEKDLRHKNYATYSKRKQVMPSLDNAWKYGEKERERERERERETEETNIFWCCCVDTLHLYSISEDV